jgi:DNA-binding transcriptional LysR family regulator
MEYIIALSKMLNFTKAAAAMRTTQPAFSRVISSAEEELGVVLFERSRRHVRLTPAGEAMIPQLERALKCYAEGLRQAKDVSVTYAGELKVGYIPDTINQDIRLLVERFSERNRQVKVSLFETHYYELQNQLLSEELDIVIYTSMQSTFPEELDYYPLFETPLCAIMHESHPLASCSSISPLELRDEPFIVLEHDATMSGSWSFVHLFASEYGFSPWIVCQTSMLSSALLQVSCNKGICIASQFAGHLAPENVKIIPISGSSNCIRYAIWRRNNQEPALRGFVYCVKSSFGNN